ncbi:hypothetical protein OX283_010000 [Flavobacterium sp. SUN052]|uniref:hypothetical protein n=1 Tax=Flavobacterium sp. SUN052 TaxID=3002441 RepID=UPI00237E12E6|nr:hypothetical protein [Flavobacterium sp. SUN052]MEC4004989.1 hypothetical protein [Flavobacterium sp. SUN052]
MTSEGVINEVKIQFEKVLVSNLSNELKVDKMMEIALLYQQKSAELKLYSKSELKKRKASEYFQTYKKKNIEKIKERSRLYYLRKKEAANNK